MLSIKEISYLAGLIDAKAYGFVQRKYPKGIYFRTSNATLAEFLEKTFHARIVERPDKRFVCSWPTKQSIQLVMTIYPLVSLRTQCDIRYYLHCWRSNFPRKVTCGHATHHALGLCKVCYNQKRDRLRKEKHRNAIQQRNE